VTCPGGSITRSPAPSTILRAITPVVFARVYVPNAPVGPLPSGVSRGPCREFGVDGLRRGREARPRLASEGALEPRVIPAPVIAKMWIRTQGGDARRWSPAPDGEAVTK